MASCSGKAEDVYSVKTFCFRLEVIAARMGNYFVTESSIEKSDQSEKDCYWCKIDTYGNMGAKGR